MDDLDGVIFEKKETRLVFATSIRAGLARGPDPGRSVSGGSTALRHLAQSSVRPPADSLRSTTRARRGAGHKPAFSNARTGRATGRPWPRAEAAAADRRR